MDRAKSQIDDSARRRSMLPQKSRIKSVSKPMETFPKENSLEAGGQCIALARQRTSAVLQAAKGDAATMLPPGNSQPYARMRPPANLRRPSSKSDSTQIGHSSRQPSTSRKSGRDHGANGLHPSQNLNDLSEPRPQLGTSSGSSNPQSNTRESFHARSSSRQVRHNPTAGLLQSTSLPQRQSSMEHSRPEFSATQQHFSPKDAIQLNPSSLSSQPSTDTSPSGDIFRLQMELAQLHLLHRSVFSVQSQWENSAKRSFEHQFGALCERHIELKEIAYQQQTLINQISLVRWSQGRSGAQISENVQLLSHSIAEICNLLGLEGKYTHILEIFESWFSQALRVRSQREPNGRENGRDLDLIDGIGDGWKAEAMVLERELTYSARDLEGFGEVFEKSSLCRILSMYRKLVMGLLEELDLVQWIENEIMSQETVWIESTIHNLASIVSESIIFTDPDRKAA